MLTVLSVLDSLPVTAKEERLPQGVFPDSLCAELGKPTARRASWSWEPREQRWRLQPNLSSKRGATDSNRVALSLGSVFLCGQAINFCLTSEH